MSATMAPATPEWITAHAIHRSDQSYPQSNPQELSTIGEHVVWKITEPRASFVHTARPAGRSDPSSNTGDDERLPVMSTSVPIELLLMNLCRFRSAQSPTSRRRFASPWSPSPIGVQCRRWDELREGPTVLSPSTPTRAGLYSSGGGFPQVVGCHWGGSGTYPQAFPHPLRRIIHRLIPSPFPAVELARTGHVSRETYPRV